MYKGLEIKIENNNTVNMNIPSPSLVYLQHEVNSPPKCILWRPGFSNFFFRINLNSAKKERVV